MITYEDGKKIVLDLQRLADKNNTGISGLSEGEAILAKGLLLIMTRMGLVK